MPLTPIQTQVFGIIAGNRSEASIVAGGIAVARATQRTSHDIDVTHASSAAMRVASDVDFAALRSNGFRVVVDVAFEKGLGQTFRRAVVSRDDGNVLLEWVVDADFRFFPPIPDQEFGFVLSPIDIGINKVLAAANRSEARDILDLVALSARYLPLGAFIAAATGVDPGWSPESLINEMTRNTRRDPSEYAALPNVRPEDLERNLIAYRAELRAARDYVARLPSEALGKVYLENGRPTLADPDRLDTYHVHLPVRGGHWPTSPGVINEMLAERHGIAWDRPGKAEIQ